nr:MAG TPA: hypothetical protein [Caudoviricetes sp.]
MLGAPFSLRGLFSIKNIDFDTLSCSRHTRAGRDKH